MTKEQAAWLAGYIDGDGCICLTYGGKKGSRYRTARIVIDSCDPELLDHVAEITGMGNLITKKKTIDHHRQARSWRLSGMSNVLSILEEIHPYMRCAVKKARATMLLSEWKNCTPRNGVYSAEAKNRKQNFEAAFLAIGEGRGKRARPSIIDAGKSASALVGLINRRRTCNSSPATTFE
jgi:hypothetical protein